MWKDSMPGSSDDNNRQNSVKARCTPLHSVIDAKMGFEHSIQRLSKLNNLRQEQEANITEEPTCRKCLSTACISKLNNKLCEDDSDPETQKLKGVVSWAELLPDRSVGCIIQEIRKPILDHDPGKEIAQKSKCAINKSADYFNPKLLHANVLSPFVASEDSLEHAGKLTSYSFLNSNVSSHLDKDLCPTQIAKHGREATQEDISVSTNILEEYEVDGHIHCSTRKDNFWNLDTVCEGNDLCTPTMNLQKNESYFWAPLSDSSDEEWSNVKTNSLKLLDAELTEHKISYDSASFFKLENIKLFKPMLGSRHHSMTGFDSCDKWNPAKENLLEFKNYKCKNFLWTLKSEGSSGTKNSVESICKEATDKNNLFNPMTKVKKDVSRDRVLDFEPEKDITAQRNKLAHKLNMGKTVEGRKHRGKSQDTRPSHGFGCNRDQRKIELKSLMSNSDMKIKSFGRNSLLEPPENCKVDSASENLCCKSLSLCSNSDCILLDKLPLFSGDNITCKSNMSQRCLQSAINKNISEDDIASVVDSQSCTREFLITRVNVDDQELFQNDTLYSDSNCGQSVLAKYYFYLNYLSKSKRLRREDESQLFSCKQHDGFSEEAKIASLCCWKSDHAYKQQANEHRNSDFETSNIGCRAYKKTVVIDQQTHIEEQESKSLPASSSPKPLSSPGLTNSVLLDNPHILKGTQSRQQLETAIQAPDEISAQKYGDQNLLPWLQLPDELWLCIFSWLAHKDICRVSQVCQRFYQLAGDESLWKEIQLTDCCCLNDDWLISLGNRHPERFTLDHCHDEAQRITDVGFKHFFWHCQGTLKELNIKSCSGPGFRGDIVLIHASAFCHKLTMVDISWTGATDSGVMALIKTSRSLQCLSANGCQITDDSVTTLVEKHGKSLKKLEIFGCHAITPKCLKSVAGKCPNIKVLNIGKVHKITEDCLKKIVNSMRKLTSLNCTGLSTVRDCFVHFMVKRCPELECLILSSCSQVTDISLMEISTYLPKIRYLDVSNCKLVTDTGVQALAGSCCKLSYIDLSSTAASKRGVRLLASFCFRTLECVKLSFCKDISLASVTKLCKNCKRLKILHLYGCRFVPDQESIKKINNTVEMFHDLPVPAAMLSSV